MEFISSSLHWIIDGVVIYFACLAADWTVYYVNARKNKKFEDMICENPNCGKSRRLKLAIDKITWLCYTCRPIYNKDLREKQHAAKQIVLGE